VISNNKIEVNDGYIVTLYCVKEIKQGEYYYNDAIAYLSTLILNKQVTIEGNGFVWWDGRLINENLIKNGYGMYDNTMLDNTYCQAMGQDNEVAKVTRVGLWKFTDLL
jgi:endonuclease YncB( thermonuclease family)